MKVVMVGDFPLDGESIDGGVQAVTHTLCHEMADRNNIELVLVTFAEVSESKKMHLANDVVLHIIPRQSLGMLTGYKNDVANLHSLLIELEPDIVHGQGLGVSGLAVVTSRWPSVVTAHGVVREDLKYLPTLLSRLRGLVQSHVAESYCVKNAKHLISISEYIDSYFGSKIRGKVYKINNPVPASYFRLARRPENARILFAGKVTVRKGVHYILEAMQILSTEKLSLQIAGSTSDKTYVEYINRKAKRAGLNERINLLGLLDDSQLMEEFSKCQLLILPSMQETAPMVIQQAMASGIPVVATNVGGVKFQLANGNGFICPPRDPQALAGCITEALDLYNGDGYGEFCQRVVSKAKSQYHVTKVVDETIAVYEAILREGACISK